VLADWQFRHPMTVGRAGALWGGAARLDVADVDGALVELDLPLNVPEPPFDEIGSVCHCEIL
jgi:hypothetical protein